MANRTFKHFEESGLIFLVERERHLQVGYSRAKWVETRVAITKDELLELSQKYLKEQCPNK